MLNLIGEKYNYLTVIGVDRVVKGKGTYWKCKCDCGNETVVIGQSLRNGHTKSCGCLGKYKALENLINARGCCFENLSGMTFGRLTVTPYFEKRGRSYYWKCVCSCGNESDVWVRASHLKSGDTQSCGCLAREVSSKIHTKHGMSKTRFYSIWSGLFDRCYNDKMQDYKYYGEKGISVCDRWSGNCGFINFKEDMYESYQKHVEEYGEQDTTIDRINSDDNYYKENCRWATHKQQANNRSSKLIPR